MTKNEKSGTIYCKSFIKRACERECIMFRIDDTVKQETIYIAIWTLLFSVILQAVFLVIGKWDITVLWGNLLSYIVSVLNFFLMGIGVQKAVLKDEKEAKKIIKLSHTYRTMLLFAAIAFGVALSCFNIWATLIPYLFPRIAITLRPLFNRK